ncbi:MAG: 30S ribosomal protein S8 [Candidatus Altiarchaeota archaeon]
MMHDLINDAITAIRNAERVGKSECIVKPTSKLLIEILKIFQREGYIGEFEVISDRKGGSIRIELKKKIHDCGVIKPRYATKKEEFTKWEKRYLPAKDFGIIILTTPKGVMTHKEAILNGTGGRLLAYVY